MFWTTIYIYIFFKKSETGICGMATLEQNLVVRLPQKNLWNWNWNAWTMILNSIPLLLHILMLNISCPVKCSTNV